MPKAPGTVLFLLHYLESSYSTSFASKGIFIIFV